MFDYDILFEFLPDEDKKSFMTWDDVEITQSWSSIPNSVATIVATFTDFQGFEKIVIIPVDEYEVGLKQKERDNKINDLLC